MASTQQRTVARRNIKKAAAAARRKRTVAHLPAGGLALRRAGRAPKLNVANGNEIRQRQALASATVRKMLCNRNNTDANAVIAASQTANAVFTTQPGAAPTRRSRSGRKFHVVRCT